MSKIDWSSCRKIRQPTRKERGLYQRWVKYLKDSRLTGDEIHRRAAAFAEQGREPESSTWDWRGI